MSMPAARISCGIEPAAGHADLRPAGPVEHEAARAGAAPDEVGDRPGEEVVGGGVVGLSAVAEAAGDRAEGRRWRRSASSPSAGSRLNQPSALTSKTRSNSAGGLSGEQAADLEAGGVQEHVDPTAPRRSAPAPRRRPRRRAGRRGGSAHGRRRREIAAIAASAALRRSRPASSLSIDDRRGALAARRPGARRARASGRRGRRRSGRGRGPAGSGSAARSSRWKVPPDAAARSATIAETMLPAAPVTTKTLSGPSVQARPVAAGSSRVDQGQGEALAALQPISTAPGSRSVSRPAASRRRRPASAPVSKSTALTSVVGPLAREGLGEAGDRAAQRAGRARRVVAVPPPEPGGGDDEGARRRRAARRARAG